MEHHCTQVREEGIEGEVETYKNKMEMGEWAGTETYKENDDAGTSDRSNARGREMRLDLLSTTRLNKSRSRLTRRVWAEE